MRTLLSLLLLLGCKDDPVDTGTSEFDIDQISSTDRPSQRSEIYGIGDSASNSILVFGGNEGPVVDQIPKAVYLEETWIFEPGTGWTELDIDMPSARARYGAAYDANGERALIFGGRFREEGASGNYDLFSELWEFDFSTREWTLLDDGSGPSDRFYPSLAWDDESGDLYLFGGLTNADPMTLRVSEETWKWDGSDWEELNTSGDEPSTRTFLAETYDPTRKRMVFFAGQVGDYWSNAYNETYALDIETLEWTELNDGDDAPSTRMHPHMVYDADRDRYLAFGGHTDIGDGNDLWAMDPDSGAWSLIREADTFTGSGLGCGDNSSDVPADYVEQDLSAPERRHRGMFTVMHDNLWIFGGMHAECSNHLDDTWRYPLDGGDWTELIEARTGESCARQDADCECLCY
jgi:hypothetical protein